MKIGKSAERVKCKLCKQILAAHKIQGFQKKRYINHARTARTTKSVIHNMQNTLKRIIRNIKRNYTEVNFNLLTKFPSILKNMKEVIQ